MLQIRRVRFRDLKAGSDKRIIDTRDWRRRERPFDTIKTGDARDSWSWYRHDSMGIEGDPDRNWIR